MVAALKKALRENATRIIDLFKEWDEDGDGNVSKKEFLKALPQLGPPGPRPPRMKTTGTL